MPRESSAQRDSWLRAQTVETEELNGADGVRERQADGWTTEPRLPYLGVEEVETRSELRNPVGGTFDTQLFHAVSQSVRMKAESFRCAVRTFDDAASLL